MSKISHRLLATMLLLGMGVASLTTTRATFAADPVLVGAGDIADCTLAEDEATAKLLDAIPGTVFTTGDNAYSSGTAAEFTDCYEPTWGRHKTRTRPVPGNHEYLTSDAAPYYSYFGASAGAAGQGYYSYNLGAWHIIALNSEISAAPGSAQLAWLRQDLAANAAACTLAYWHKPLFSSGEHGNLLAMFEAWKALHEYGADVVLNGHDHNYERFAPQNPYGEADPNGIREFVVGTGGKDLRSFPATAPRPNSEARNSTAHGVLKLTLHATSYDWEFVPIAGQSFTDIGSAACSSGLNPTATASPTPTMLPPSQTQQTFMPVADTYVDQASPSSAFATNSEIKVVGGTSSTRQGYLRFNVSGLPAGAAVLAATLRLFVTNGSTSGGSFNRITNNTWAETITWNTRPPIDGQQIATLGTVAAGVLVDIDVTPVVTGNGAYSFAISLPSSTTNGLGYASRENTSGAAKPALTVLAQIDGSLPTATPSSTPTATPFVAATPTAVPAPNLLQNGGFELDSNADNRPDSWTSSSRLTRSSAVVHAGGFAGKHSPTAEASYTISQQVNGLAPGTYQYAGYVNIPATTDTFTFKLEVRWLNAAGSTLRTDLVKTYSGATAGWDSAGATLSAPANTASAQVRMSASSLFTTVYVDDLNLLPAAGAPPTPTVTVAAFTPTATAGAANTPTATSVPSGATFSLLPVADTYISQASPGSAFGSSTSFSAVGGTSPKYAFLRFTVSGLTAGQPITSARLRLFVTNDSTSGGNVRALTNTTWPETMTWDSQPAIDGPQLAALGAVALNQFVEIDLTSAITGNGDYSFAITLPASNTNTLGYASRENSTAANRPLLIITT